MIRKLACIAIAVLGGMTLNAQNFSKYNFGENELIRINPASGIEDGNQAYAAYRHVWSYSTGYGEKPDDVDVGATYSSWWGAVTAEVDYDGYSFFDRHEIKLNYSYVWKLDDKIHSRFSVGGGITLGLDDINFDKLGYRDVLGGRSTYCSPDLNVGFEYNNDHIRTGLGAMNILATGIKFDETTAGQNPPKATKKGAQLVRNPRTILAYFIYRFDVHNVGISPIIFAGYCERTEMMIGLKLDYSRWIGFTYSFRAMEMAHLCALNFTIPKTPVTLDVSYSKCAFYKDQTLAAAIRVRW